MFGFGKAKSKPAPSKPEEPKLVRFYGYYNSLCQMGKPPWPPMLRNDSYHNLTEMFQIIAEALNVKHRYTFLRTKMEESVAAYDRGEKSQSALAEDFIKMLRIIQKDEKDEAPMFEEHKRKLAAYERSNGNWGG